MQNELGTLFLMHSKANLPRFFDSLTTNKLKQIVSNFSRYNKYTIGTDLRNLSRSILLLIIRANSAKEQENVLSELVEKCEILKTLLVFAKEAKAFDNFKSFQYASGVALILCKQSEGWLKSSRKSQNHQPSERMGR